jgi:hypothetical protein
MLVSATVVIDSPILEVFDYIANPSHIPEWGPFCTGVEPNFQDVPEKGTRFVANLSFIPPAMMNMLAPPAMNNVFPFANQLFFVPLQQRIEFVVDDIVPGRRIAYHANEISWTTICDFQPSDGRTILTTTHSLWSAAGLAMGYWMTPMQPILEGGVRRVHETVKRRLEGRALEAKPRIFFSYRHKSRYVGGRIFDALKSEFGAGTVFRDTDSLIAGRDWDADITTTIKQCRVIVVHIGDGWEKELLDKASDDPLRDELNAALEGNVPFIPVITSEEEGLPITKRMRDIEEALTKVDAPKLAARLNSRRQAQALRPDPDFSADLERLMRSVWYAFRQGRNAGSE